MNPQIAVWAHFFQYLSIVIESIPFQHFSGRIESVMYRNRILVFGSSYLVQSAILIE